MADGVRIEVLGPVRVLRNGAVLEVPGRRQRLLLGLLTTDRGRTVPMHRLIDVLWPDAESEPKNPVNAVQQYVASLRTCLEAGSGSTQRWPPGPGVAITWVSSGYRLDAPPGSIDLDDGHVLLWRSRTLYRDGQFAAARERSSRALDLWRGRPWEQFEAHPAFTAALRGARRLQLDLLEAWTAAATAMEDHAAVVSSLAASPGSWQSRESLVTALVVSLARLGRFPQAHRATAAYRGYAGRRGSPVGEGFAALEADILAGRIPGTDVGRLVRPVGHPAATDRLHRLLITTPVTEPRRPPERPVRFATDDVHEARRRTEQAEYHLALARAANDPGISVDRATWQAVFRRHATSLEESLAWASRQHPEVGVDLACELALWWDWSGRSGRLVNTFSELLDRLPTQAGGARGRAGTWLAFGVATRDARRALSHLDIAAQLLRHDPLELGRTRAVEAVVARATSPDRALGAAESAVRLLSEHGNAVELGYAHVVAALAALRLRDPVRGSRHLAHAQDVYGAVGDQRGLAWVDAVDARLHDRPAGAARDFHARLGDRATALLLAEATHEKGST